MNGKIAAIVLAAGLSTRMGSPKMVLPWGDTVVVRHIVDILRDSGVADILVVTGGARQQVEAALEGGQVQTVFNPDYPRDHMILSLQVGLSRLSNDISATLVALGDQPQIQVNVVRAVIGAYRQTGAELVMPSYKMRRGHPWLIKRALWSELLSYKTPQTMRQFITDHASRIKYVTVKSSSILGDIDTPSDYQRERPPERG